MKKSALIIFGLIACIVFNFSEAGAATRRYIPKPYMGADYVYTKLNYKDNLADYFEQSGSTFAVNGGMRLSEYFGFEISYQHTLESEKEEPAFTSEGRFSVYALDFLGYIPLDDDLSFNLLLTGGFGAYEYRGEITDIGGRKSVTEHATSMRFGGGLQYNFTRNIAIRAVGRYVMSSSDYVRDHFDATAGIQLTF